MPHGPLSAESQSPAVETFLLGQIPYLRCLEFQQRLLREVAQRDDGQIIVLMCEHPEVITVGRGGRPWQVASRSRLLRSRQIETHWTNRGGGCLMHCPGQLAVYPILPLRWHDFSLGEYLQRFQAALAEALTELGVQIQPQPGRYGIWGRTGQIAALGVAVRDWVTWQGAYLNVSPALGLFRLVESDPLGNTPMGSIAAERCGVVRMATARTVLVRHLTEAFGCDRYHLYTGHPWLKSQAGVA
jgi:lipoyl(octanoyl) transferase